MTTISVVFAHYNDFDKSDELIKGFTSDIDANNFVNKLLYASVKYKEIKKKADLIAIPFIAPVFPKRDSDRRFGKESLMKFWSDKNNYDNDVLNFKKDYIYKKLTQIVDQELFKYKLYFEADSFYIDFLEVD